MQPLKTSNDMTFHKMTCKGQKVRRSYTAYLTFVSSANALTISEMCFKCWDQYVVGSSEDEGRKQNC